MQNETNNSYHNTTHEQPEHCQEYEATAQAQEQQIMEYFKRVDSPQSPSEVWLALEMTGPITSARRAMTNLTKKGLLARTAVKIMGLYNRREHCWKLVKEGG